MVLFYPPILINLIMLTLKNDSHYFPLHQSLSSLKINFKGIISTTLSRSNQQSLKFINSQLACTQNLMLLLHVCLIGPQILQLNKFHDHLGNNEYLVSFLDDCTHHHQIKMSIYCISQEFLEYQPNIHNNWRLTLNLITNSPLLVLLSIHLEIYQSLGHPFHM